MLVAQSWCLAACCLVLTLLLPASAAASFSEEAIKCTVCQRAVAHVWHRGVELRKHCRETKGPDRDRRCDFHSVHPSAIDQMVWGVCDALPKTYQAVHDSEFDMILHDDPQHSDELIALITATCVKFVHDHHGVEVLGEVVQRHLQHGHGTERLLPEMTKTACHHVCVKQTPPKRERRRWEMHDVDDDEL